MVKHKIRVFTEQRHQGDKECYENVFEGTITEKNGHIFIIFKEDIEGGAQITNQIKVCKDGSISVRRMGQVQSLIQFSENKPYKTVYHTGCGAMEITFKPHMVKYIREKTGHEIELRYETHVEGSKLSDHIYNLKATSSTNI